MRRGLDVEVGIILHSVVSRCGSLGFLRFHPARSLAQPPAELHAPFLSSYSFVFALIVLPTPPVIRPLEHELPKENGQADDNRLHALSAD